MLRGSTLHAFAFAVTTWELRRGIIFGDGMDSLPTGSSLTPRLLCPKDDPLSILYLNILKTAL